MDEARLHDFMGKLVGDMGAAATLANVILGDELGLYRAMADSQPTTPEALGGKNRLPSAAGARMAERPGRFGLHGTRQGLFCACPKSRPWPWRWRTPRLTWPVGPQ